MNEQDDTKLWQLLGHASQAAPGDDFARKVMMRIAEEERTQPVPVESIRDSAGSDSLDRLDPARRLRLVRMLPITGGYSLGVPTEPGVRYQVQYTPTLRPASWTNTGNVIIGNGHDDQPLNATPPEGEMPGSQGFYRVIGVQ